MVAGGQQCLESRVAVTSSSDMNTVLTCRGLVGEPATVVPCSSTGDSPCAVGGGLHRRRGRERGG